jgi:hypothetical protein
MTSKEKKIHLAIVEKQLEGANLAEIFAEGEKSFKKRMKDSMDVDTAWKIIVKKTK